ncbi:MAG TPA: peptide ABC transporter substrate-binding protein, partial [Terriglobia bacterium]|nr:peptide ABC transporter substrate-binding protein [Terriglobia bacterium]
MLDWSVRSLLEDLKSGRIGRRQFIATLTRVGIPIGVVASMLASCGSEGDSSGADAPAIADGPFEPKQRGGGGQLKLLYWQAPSILNPHMTRGTKDVDASSLFYEQLLYIDADANFVPRLITEIPNVENGLLDRAGMWVIWKLKSGVKWHDGKPFGADDVVFNWEYAADTNTAAITQGTYTRIRTVERIGDLEVRVMFKEPNLDWSSPWSNSNGMLIPAHVMRPFKGKEARNAPLNLRPVGTGAYKVVEFRPDDLVLAEINAEYHLENRPFFDRIELKGGGDAAGAARAVLQSGEYDFAWNLQVDGNQLEKMEQEGIGTIVKAQGGTIEHILLNFTDPNTEVDGERSSVKVPHPFFSDIKVRQAFALAIDRKTIVERLYVKTASVASFYVWAPSKYVPDSKWERDLERANRLLDEAGWTKGPDGMRVKNGKRMRVLFQTSNNKLRQDTQAVVKKDLESLGVEVELKAIIADVFFSGDPTNDDTLMHFYADMEMFAQERAGPDDAVVFFQSFDSSQLPQKSNKWAKLNYSRYVNKQFDALHERA